MATAAKTVKASQSEGRTISIVRPEISQIICVLTGITPLLQNPKTEEYIQSIISGQNQPHPVNNNRDPQLEFEKRLRKHEGKYIHPIEAFIGQHGCIVEASKANRLKKITAKTVITAVQALPDCLAKTPEGIVPSLYLDSPGAVSDFHMATIWKMGKPIPVPIYRPRHDKWGVTLRLNYWPSLVSQSALISLLVTAGQLGIGAYKTGGFGRFEVTSAKQAI